MKIYDSFYRTMNAIILKEILGRKVKLNHNNRKQIKYFKENYFKYIEMIFFKSKHSFSFYLDFYFKKDYIFTVKVYTGQTLYSEIKANFLLAKEIYVFEEYDAKEKLDETDDVISYM